MLQETVARAAGLPDLAAPIVVCNESHRFMVAEQLREFGAPAQAIILEPVGRNTAPAVAVAALVALEQARKAHGEADPDPLLLVLPADHVIRDVAAFQAAVMAGRVAAEQGKLVTFGVVPDRPETGYGYICRKNGDTPYFSSARNGALKIRKPLFFPCENQECPHFSGGAVRRETRRRHREDVRRVRRVLLEQRHVPVSRLGVPRRTRAIRAGDALRLPRPRSPRRRATSTSRGCRRTSSQRARATRSTMR